MDWGEAFSLAGIKAGAWIGVRWVVLGKIGVIMAIHKGTLFATGDVFIDYPFEMVMFRWDCAEQRIYKKFYGKEEIAEPVLHDGVLFNDALLSGKEITRDQYENGLGASEYS